MSSNPGEARELAARYQERGDPLGWFEPLYASAERGEGVVPWAHRVPNSLLVGWAEATGASGEGRTALVPGCGLGDDAEYLAGLGFTVTAFDIAPTAVAAARRRFPGGSVRYATADLLDPPAAWRGAFDLVAEAYTLQVLRGPLREHAVASLAGLVAPGGTLLVVARAREEHDPPGHMPWPLTRAEVGSFEAHALTAVRVDLVPGAPGGDPPVRYWRAEFRAA
ncbi:methyltransferase type 12 [Sphaerisporangium siamense]|uniref:Methyltransferase domain-containing protein n=1 Tax=Sphaerisporangium siamense TaxID=795645 RepID=A0A7W7DC19_9ACTN|nr:class I SAM-dependent methyltransferase [Sphaerisporangium siamense]MBB4704068.1 hypothetical protein [Sphaerisporangium siamense]GII82543.1 methyltransferase type 12 [Sphaerisporangium siamense]